jgi:chromosome segregation ATPase
MSTLGKVLSILVTLSLLVWIFLAAMVAKHHENWGERVSALKADIAKIKPEFPPLETEIEENRSQATLLQVALIKAQTNFRNALTMAQTTESDTKEALSRYTLQLATAEQEVKAAQARQEVRAREKADLDKAILREQAAVQDLIAENKALKDELAGLQKSFLDTVAENKTYADRLLKAAKPSAPTGPRTRLGSFVR